MSKLFRINELILCCNAYPRYHSADGLCWVQCEECGNRSQTYILGRTAANEGWNEHRKLQSKVENIYTGKEHWYKNEEKDSSQAT